MLQIVALVELAVCWTLWTISFIEPRKRAAGQKAVVRAPASKLGILFQFVGFACVWMYIRPAGYSQPVWELTVSMILAPPSVALVWAATRHLGKQWRFEAALNQDHELIRTGPYRLLRHPIYASMLGMLLSTGLAYTWWPMLAPALVFFIAGIEIRVRTEDRLLAERFGDTFSEYRSRVKAYVPFLR